MIVQHQPDLLLAPASVSKLITSSVALETLGPGFRFASVIAVAGSLDRNTGVLSGDLVIQGGGDPVTGSGFLDSDQQGTAAFAVWMDAIRRIGIQSVTGDLVVDVSAFSEWAAPGKWTWEDIGNYYGAAPAAINLYDNTVKLYFESPRKPGERTRITSVVPEIPGITWENEVIASSVNRDLAYVYGSPWGTMRLVRGSIPAGRKQFEVKAAMPDPPLIFGNLLRENLQKSGIPVAGNVRKAILPVQAEMVHTLLSPPLARICSILNHESVNLIAESIVMQLAYQKNGFGSHDEGMKIMNTFLSEKWGNGKFFLDDGSGLTRFTAVTARGMNDLLINMHHSPTGEILKSTMPVAGSGTLRSFSTQAFPGVTLRCKSGSMTRVRAFAGYLVTRDGNEVAFTIMVNNFPGTQQEVFRAIENFLIAVRSVR